MADQMRPPTKEELDRYRREYLVDQASAVPSHLTASSTSSADGGGFIEDEKSDVLVYRMIDGKLVYGPARPPATV